MINVRNGNRTATITAAAAILRFDIFTGPPPGAGLP
jgi:hypothetical protein